MEPARFVAFTDGSCLKNPGGPGGAGFIVFDRSLSALRYGGERYTTEGKYDVTNNRMELRAVIHALEGLPEGASVEVVTDSQYLVDAATKWIHGWRRRGWKTAAGEPVHNRDLIEALDARGLALKVRYRWVRGHNGEPLNELADALANAAARAKPGPTKEEIVRELGPLVLPRAG